MSQEKTGGSKSGGLCRSDNPLSEHEVLSTLHDGILIFQNTPMAARLLLERIEALENRVANLETVVRHDIL